MGLVGLVELVGCASICCDGDACCAGESVCGGVVQSCEWEPRKGPNLGSCPHPATGEKDRCSRQGKDLSPARVVVVGSGGRGRGHGGCKRIEGSSGMC